MRLKHEIDDDARGLRHRIVDLDKPSSPGEWVGYRTPAVYRPVKGRCGHFVALTDYYRGSNEFPEPHLIYHVSGLDKAVISSLAECQMATEVWLALDEYLDDRQHVEDDFESTKLERLKDFVLFLNVRIQDMERKEGRKEGVK